MRFYELALKNNLNPLMTKRRILFAFKVVKVADFGVARYQSEGVMTAETGTYRWMAPEVMNPSEDVGKLPLLTSL